MSGVRRANLAECKSLKLNDLNCFEELVYLEFQWPALGREKLSLRNLRIAILENIDIGFNVTDFDLDCPGLKVLGIAYHTRLWPTDETAESIQHLYVQNSYNTQNYLFLLYPKLKNLSTIGFRWNHDLSRFVVALIERRVQLPSLNHMGRRKERNR